MCSILEDPLVTSCTFFWIFGVQPHRFWLVAFSTAELPFIIQPLQQVTIKDVFVEEWAHMPNALPGGVPSAARPAEGRPL